MIIKSFRQVGLSLNPDGSKDLEIKIKDLEGIEVGNWELEIDITQEEDEESIAMEAVLEAEKAPKLPAIIDDNDKNNEQDINITKASLRPRKLARDQYFTAEEAAAADTGIAPLIVNNQEDSDTLMAEGFDTDSLELSSLDSDSDFDDSTVEG
jgi:hypothetical protein